ncbi:hypothetical protein CDAR_238571 [Caerostris darwini]|uniref:Uncharacterized protein n=1 Tax=Caerostris darwini TaxID=1538125 RepID=A0AAV4TLX4_9ARAC|nr:hypothetical protein CDAR_46911 [Caerostris darwini]GIY46372.1 hypothetical protein CDAR_238571 [Caerostris darwini]
MREIGPILLRKYSYSNSSHKLSLAGVLKGERRLTTSTCLSSSYRAKPSCKRQVLRISDKILCVFVLIFMFFQYYLVQCCSIASKFSMLSRVVKAV